MKEDGGQGVFAGRRFEEEDVAVMEKAAGDFGAWRGIDGKARVADGDFAVITDAGGGAQAPEEAPPRAGGSRADAGVFLGQGGLMCGVGGGAEFTMDFVVVGVGEEGFEQWVGGLDGAEVVCGEERREAFLPVVVAAFDFAFGLRSGCETQGDSVKVQGRSELGEGIWSVGEKEGVEIDVESEREAVGEEGAGEEIQVREQRLGRVETRAGVEASGVVKNVQKHLFVRTAGEERVRRGVVLPERAEVTDLPAANRLGGLLGAGIRGELAGDGPAADAGAVGFEIQAAEQFAGDGAGGRARRGTQQTGGQRDRIRRPGRMMIAAREPRLPGVGPARRTGPEIIGAKLVNAGQPQAQLGGQCGGAKLARPQPGKEMTDQRRRKTAGELWFSSHHQ